MLFHLQARPDVERHLARSQGIIIPIGSNPRLPTAEVDKRIMEVAAAGLAEDYRRWMARAAA